VPLQNIVRMGGSIADLQAVADAPPEAEKPKQSTGAAVAGIAGRLGGFGRKKEDKPEDQKQAEPGGTMLFEMTTERSLFSTASVDTSKFEIPAGFKEQQSDIAKKAK